MVHQPAGVNTGRGQRLAAGDEDLQWDGLVSGICLFGRVGFAERWPQLRAEWRRAVLRLAVTHQVAREQRPRCRPVGLHSVRSVLEMILERFPHATATAAALTSRSWCSRDDNKEDTETVKECETGESESRYVAGYLVA